MFHRGMLLASSLLFSSCALAGDNAIPQGRACKAGEACEVQGQLDLFRQGAHTVGVVGDPKTCVALALPSRVMRHFDKWNRMQVKASGVAYTQPNAPELVWYAIRDRKVAAHFCESSIVIYVEAIDPLK